MILRAVSLFAVMAVTMGVASPAEELGAVNPKALGAKGDGIADDTAAIQAALDAAAKGSKIVRVPAGRYAITGSLVVPAYVSLTGEESHWENMSTSIEIKKNGFPAIRLAGPWASVKGLHIVYPDNGNVSKPDKYPPAIQVEAGHVSVEDVNLALAWDGISTPEAGANAGQSLFRNITGFVHNVGIRVSGPLNVVRIEDVHWFVPHGVDAFGGSPYYVNNRVAFEIGNVDGLMMTRCFMIFGKTFFRQLPGKASLGHHISQCWIEHVQNGFLIEGLCGFVLSDTNILIDKPDGVGISLTMPSLYYNCAISNTQVRYAGAGSGPALVYAPTEPHYRNWVGVANCQFDTPGKNPAVRIGPRAERAKIEGCHITGRPAVLIEKGARQVMVRGNFLKGAIEDNTPPDAKKVINDNISDL